MTSSALVLVLLAAALHAGWNALARAGADPVLFLWLANAVGAVALAPFAIAVGLEQGITASALPFVAATVVLHTIYFYALGRAYRVGDLSLVYPIARGLGVALVPVLALAAFDERPSTMGALGVGLVVFGTLGLPLTGSWLTASRVPTAAPRFGGATAWAVLTGLTIAAYSVVDKSGVTRMPPLLYLALANVGVTCLLGGTVVRGTASIREEWRARGRAIVIAGIASSAAYVLVLHAFQSSKVGYVVAARECSIVLSALIGTVWFREGRAPVRLAGAAVILAGVVCVAIAR